MECGPSRLWLQFRVLYDAVIIGAGPAGSVAAYVLASAGHRVALIEQHRFPRDKVCGECLSDVGITTLSELGLATALRAARPAILTRAALHAPSGASATLELPRPMWGLSRLALDTMLRDAAVAAGAELYQPARCEALASDGRGATLRLRDLRTNTVDPLNARYAIVADGKSALLPTRPMPTTDFGIKAHFAGANGPTDVIELFGLCGHYAGLAPIEGGGWNLAFSVPRQRLRATRDLDDLFQEMLNQNPAMRDRLGGASRVGEWLASPLPRFAVRRDWPLRVIAIGNAVAALEPIGGEGMGLAIKRRN